MFGQFFSSFGGAIGGSFGGGIFSTIGRYAGKKFADYLDKKNRKTEIFYQYHNLKDSFNFIKANYGDTIPLIFGSSRVVGKIIWADKVSCHENTAISRDFISKPKNTHFLTYTTDISYNLSFAIAVCEGEILELGRIWAGNDIIDIGRYQHRIYKGAKDQMPDPLISAKNNGIAPAFRDLAYIVFENMPLADFDNIIPCFSFEVTRKANISTSNSLGNKYVVEDLITAVNIIPGSGEYVYDTKIQHKILKSPDGYDVSKDNINSHNRKNIADSVYSLEQLKQVCQNVKWVAPVVCWFGSDLDAANCQIKPAIEFNRPLMIYSESWQVANYNRDTAHEISKDEHNNPKYGGSINDASVLRYLEELRRKDLKIMFYPMLFLDVDGKPWRGKVTGEPKAIIDFFNKKHGYNDFIIHYAKLVKNHVDAFIIGSELVGLTKVRDKDNSFPAVNELIKLANIVKQIVDINVLVTYAADWSEYHHTTGGWYNLDPLWSSKAIDFIGIDAYFPVTRTTSSVITDAEISAGFHSGEGYDCYYSNGTKFTLDDPYAWKNIRYWWENQHRNPDGKFTSWQPKSKKIWFTEFGFPSIDKATNQPNIFYDPFCLDGGVPRGSTGATDLSIQRKAIHKFIEYWQTEEYIEQMFLWAWDARPYPAWPHMDIWRDGYLWQKGHWVNNKFGTGNIAAIILEISCKCQINVANIVVSSIDETIEGVIFDNQITCFDAIDRLRVAFFFDYFTIKNKIYFTKRAKEESLTIAKDNLLNISANSAININKISSKLIIDKLNLYYLDKINDYQLCHVYFNNETNAACSSVSFNLNFSSSRPETQRIANLILQNAASETAVINFTLSIAYLYLKAGDFINLVYLDKTYQIRLINIKITDLKIMITGIIDNIANYYNLPQIKTINNITYHKLKELEFIILDLPFYLTNNKAPYLVAYLTSNHKEPLYVSSKNEVDNYLTHLKPGNSIAICQQFRQPEEVDIFTIDYTSKIIITSENDLTFIVSDDNWHLALVGKEFIRFKQLQKIESNLYEISHLMRGQFATEKHLKHEQSPEKFIILDYDYNLLPLNPDIREQEFTFNINDKSQQINFINRASHPLAPFITNQTISDDQILTINWQARFADDGNWQYQPKLIPQKYIILLTTSERTYRFEVDDVKKSINLLQLGLSPPFYIDIITENKCEE